MRRYALYRVPILVLQCHDFLFDGSGMTSVRLFLSSEDIRVTSEALSSRLFFRGIVEETPNAAEHGRSSVMLEKYASATKMQPQSSGSLRSNAGIEKGKEIAARLNVHRIHSQLRGLDSTGWFRSFSKRGTEL